MLRDLSKPGVFSQDVNIIEKKNHDIGNKVYLYFFRQTFPCI